MKMVHKLFIIAGLLLTSVLCLAFITDHLWPRINDVKTGETPEYPDLQPQSFAQPFYRVYDAALATVRDLEWEILSEDRASGEIQALAMVPVLRIKDEVTITIKPDGDRVSVNIRSRSRVGKSDLGVNARRIRRFQEELARRL